MFCWRASFHHSGDAVLNTEIYYCLYLWEYILWLCALRLSPCVEANMVLTCSLCWFSAGLPACLSVYWPQNCFYKCRNPCSIALQSNRLTRLFSYSRDVEWRGSLMLPIKFPRVSQATETKPCRTLSYPSCLCVSTPWLSSCHCCFFVFFLISVCYVLSLTWSSEENVQWCLTTVAKHDTSRRILL